MTVHRHSRHRPKPALGRPRRGRKKPAHDPRASGAPHGERLQKVMAAAGIGSRRRCEELILAGRVEVDRRVVRTLGTRVDAERQEVRVDGTPLAHTRRVYYLVNKPVGVVSTNFDPSGRTRVIDLLPRTAERLFTVGRLDQSSEGLILVTNDGELANQLAHPRYGVRKTYLALVAGKPEPEVLEQLRRGVHLAEGVARVVSVKVKKSLGKSTLLELVLAEGRNREIRRILAKVGHKVLRLKRVALGGVRLKELAPGEHRPLRHDELRALRGEVRRTRSASVPLAQPDSVPRPRSDARRSKPRRRPRHGTAIDTRVPPHATGRRHRRERRGG